MASVPSNLCLLLTFLHSVFGREHQGFMSFCLCTPVHSLPGFCCLPQGACPEHLGAVNSILCAPCGFWGNGVMWHSLHGEHLEWWFVSTRMQAGLRSHAGEGEKPNPLAQSLGRWDWVPLNSFRGLCHLLVSVKSCESPPCVCRDQIHQKWLKNAG